MGTQIDNTNVEYVHGDTIQADHETHVVYRNIPAPGEPEIRSSGQNMYPSIERPRPDESFVYYDRNGNPIVFSQPPNIAASGTVGKTPDSEPATPKKFERKGSFKKIKKQLSKIGTEIKNVPNKM